MARHRAGPVMTGFPALILLANLKLLLAPPDCRQGSRRERTPCSDTHCRNRIDVTNHQWIRHRCLSPDVLEESRRGDVDRMAARSTPRRAEWQDHRIASSAQSPNLAERQESYRPVLVSRTSLGRR